MIIRTSNFERVVDVGSSDILFSVYSTIMIKLKQYHPEIKDAVEFLNSGDCNGENALECARQINLIRDRLSQIKPEDAVYDMNDLTKKAPWAGNISPTITSCGNMFTTSDGKDLLFEIVSILTYAFYTNNEVKIE